MKTGVIVQVMDCSGQGCWGKERTWYGVRKKRTQSHGSDGKEQIDDAWKVRDHFHHVVSLAIAVSLVESKIDAGLNLGGSQEEVVVVLYQLIVHGFISISEPGGKSTGTFHT